jgi:TonB family protein
MRPKRPRGWRRPRQRPFRRLLAGAILSLALHAALVLALDALGAFTPPPAAPIEVVALAPLTSSAWEANRALQSDAEKPLVKAPAPPPPKPPEEKVRPGEVVEAPLARPQDSVPPGESARKTFRAQKDHFADRNVVSRDADIRYQNNLPAPQAGRIADGARPVPGEGGDAAAATPGAEGPRGEEGTGASVLRLPAQSPSPRIALAPGEGGEGEVAARRGRDRIPGNGTVLMVPGAPGRAEAGAKLAGNPDLSVRAAPQMERIAGGPMVSILGLEEGDATILNTREFKYATYLNRVYRDVGQEWNPERAYRVRDPDFRIYPVKDRHTTVLAKLDANGHVKEVKIIRGSGLDFLDREAVRAFRDAGPFPNPPGALVDENGEIDYPLSFTFRITPRGEQNFYRRWRPNGLD